MNLIKPTLIEQLTVILAYLILCAIAYYTPSVEGNY